MIDIKKHITFPLVDDDISDVYIWDNVNKIIVIFDKNSTIGERKASLGEFKETFNNSGIYSLNNSIIYRNGVIIGCVRGYGRLSYFSNGGDIQDEIGKYIVKCLNDL